MTYSHEEIVQLEAILEAEALGQPVNGLEAQQLAHRIGELYPAVSSTMHLIIKRMEGRGAEVM